MRSFILFDDINFLRRGKSNYKIEHLDPDLYHVAMRASSYVYNRNTKNTVTHGMAWYNVEHNITKYCIDTKAEKYITVQ
jgi:hypothetical protein